MGNTRQRGCGVGVEYRNMTNGQLAQHENLQREFQRNQWWLNNGKAGLEVTLTFKGNIQRDRDIKAAESAQKRKGTTEHTNNLGDG
jgi:hypothetical protein